MNNARASVEFDNVEFFELQPGLRKIRVEIWERFPARGIKHRQKLSEEERRSFA